MSIPSSSQSLKKLSILSKINDVIGLFVSLASAIAFQFYPRSTKSTLSLCQFDLRTFNSIQDQQRRPCSRSSSTSRAFNSIQDQLVEFFLMREYGLRALSILSKINNSSPLASFTVYSVLSILSKINLSYQHERFPELDFLSILSKINWKLIYLNSYCCTPTTL